MGELNLQTVKLEPGSNGYLYRSNATYLEENQSSNAPSSGHSGTSVLDEAQSPVDDTSPSPSPLCPAPLCRQFWKAGSYAEDSVVSKSHIQNNKSYLHVHPKFLHTNATSHKWAFGAFAELLDNAIDEIPNGATFVIVDKISNPRDGSPALLIQDDGGGMDPTAIRRCMSFGFSDKTSKSAIGQYGNGFKTSTMRLGADVIVFSRHLCNGKVTQSIGLLSYTYLSRSGRDRIEVPMVDYELDESAGKFNPLRGSTTTYLQSNLSVLLQWSPFSTEEELLKQFDDIFLHGTKVIVYNLWETDDRVLEFDFETDPEDIRLVDSQGTANRRTLKSTEHIGNVFRYSLRVYLSILYLRIPQNFRIVLRGKVVQHHNIADDLKFIEYILYKPQTGGTVEGQVVTTIGFLKEAPDVNIHGFNVYYKNRLIMPFWHVVSYLDNRGRGVVGILEANFVQPTHNKQDFERTSLFQKLEHRLKEMTWEYWDYHCGLVGYMVKRKLPPKPSFERTNVVKDISNSSALHGPGSSALPLGLKRTHQSFSAEPEHAKRLAGSRPCAAVAAESVPLQIQPPTSALNMGNPSQVVIEENRKLRRRCVEHKKTLEELNQTVVLLRSEIEGAKDEYARLLLELKQLGAVKNEK